jgi:hypothetical protein
MYNTQHMVCRKRESAKVHLYKVRYPYVQAVTNGAQKQLEILVWAKSSICCCCCAHVCAINVSSSSSSGSRHLTLSGVGRAVQQQ